jgi:hypothetical protein
MRFAFYLWSHDEVARNSDVILGRLREGTMPCDGTWRDEQIAVFQDWVEAGTPA